MANFEICAFPLAFFCTQSMQCWNYCIRTSFPLLCLLSESKSHACTSHHRSSVQYFCVMREKKIVYDSFSDFVLFKEKFWHDKSVVYHHLVGFIHFYIRSLCCHFRVLRVKFLFIFRVELHALPLSSSLAIPFTFWFSFFSSFLLRFTVFGLLYLFSYFLFSIFIWTKCCWINLF